MERVARRKCVAEPIGQLLGDYSDLLAVKMALDTGFEMSWPGYWTRADASSSDLEIHMVFREPNRSGDHLQADIWIYAEGYSGKDG